MPEINLTCEDNMALMSRYPDKFFDLAIVDPPYGIGEDGRKNHTRGWLASPKDYRSKKRFDDEPPSKEFFTELKRVSKYQIIWGANHFVKNIPGANSPCWIIWDKKNDGTDFADCELAYTSFKTAARVFRYKWNGMLQEDMKNKEPRYHPNQKPVALYKWLLANYAKPGDKILDTHLGSGSIAIACYDLGFDLVGCELDPDYYRDMMKRYTDHVQSKPIIPGLEYVGGEPINQMKMFDTDE